MTLPYEKQIKMLLCELENIQKLFGRRCENTDNNSALYEQCREIELALDYLKEKQRSVLVQWQKIGGQERMKLVIPVMDGIDKMTALARQIGCEAVGEYFEAAVMEEVLDMIDWTE